MKKKIFVYRCTVTIQMKEEVNKISGSVDERQLSALFELQDKLANALFDVYLDTCKKDREEEIQNKC